MGGADMTKTVSSHESAVIHVTAEQANVEAAKKSVFTPTEDSSRFNLATTQFTSGRASQQTMKRFMRSTDAAVRPSAADSFRGSRILLNDQTTESSVEKTCDDPTRSPGRRSMKRKSRVPKWIKELPEIPQGKSMCVTRGTFNKMYDS